MDTTTPTIVEQAEHLLQHSLRNFAAVTVPEASYLRRSAPLRASLQQAIDARVADGSLIGTAITPGYRTYVDVPALEQRLPARGKRLHILSPFDNMVIQRKRTAAIFDFDYLIECYVPEPKRQYGYFCLPLLWADTFVGRMDCKVHRREQLLEIKSLHLEPAPGNQSQSQSTAEWSGAFREALENFLEFNQASGLKLPKQLPAPLRQSLRSFG